MPKAPELPRQIELHGRSVAYTLRRGRRRTIGLAIDHRGLRVGAPNAARLSDIEALLHKHGQWVIQKLDDWSRRPLAKPVEITDGCQWPWLGGTLALRLANSLTRRSQAIWSAPDACGNASLALFLPANGDVRLHCLRALRQKAADFLGERLRLGASRYGVPMPEFALSSARTRWGSCSPQGAIRLNWRLMFFPLPVIDYVVAHELAHLKQMNHSPRFWSEVESLCPEWQSLRNQLRQLSREIPNL